ncbi:tail fiber [Trifolium repens]|nr:tail fiber [Trifolium repens]
MGSSSRLAKLISTISFSIYFFVIIFQVPIFSVPCRKGICTTPLELTSSQLIASEVFPLFIVKALIYPGALTKAIFNQKTIPSYRNLLHDFNTRTISVVSELRRLEVLAGSYLSVGGAILGLIKPGRMGLFGILLLMWGLIRELIMEKSGFSYAKGIQIYPTIFIALVSAFFSIRRDVRQIIRTFNLKHIRKAKHF